MAVLNNIVVLELSNGLAGALCALQLADAGADVIKVEPSGGDPLREPGPKMKGFGSLFLALNRDKRSIALNYQVPEGHSVLLNLIKKADIVVEDLRPDRARDMGCTYQAFRRANPGLIHCSITPYGDSGPYADLPASELEIQGLAGSMWFLGLHGGPPMRVGADVASVGAAMFAFIGATAALHWRLTSGEGQKVSVSLAGSLLSLSSYWMADFSDPDRYSGGAMDPYCAPETGYQTKDRPILFGFLGRRSDRKEPWHRFCRSVGLDELLKDPWISEHGASMVGVGQDAQEMKPVLESALTKWSSEDLMKIIWEVGAAGAPFMSYEDLYGDPLHPQVEATGVIQDVPYPNGGKFRGITSPWATQGDLGIRQHAAPPKLGEHTEEVLQSLGYSKEAISQLRRRGTIK